MGEGDFLDLVGEDGLVHLFGLEVVNGFVLLIVVFWRNAGVSEFSKLLDDFRGDKAE